MAHTIADLVINIADKYASPQVTRMSNYTYNLNKTMLWDFLEELHKPIYIEKFVKENYKEI